MAYKYQTIGHFQIGYEEMNAEAQYILFFIHGNSGSCNTWKGQFLDPGLKHYRMIAFDLPGHGKSSPAIQPTDEYSPIETSKVIAEAVKILAEDKCYCLIGFSYGTNIIAEMLNFGLCPKGLAFVGASCLGADYGIDIAFQASKKPSIFFYNEEDQRVVRAFFKQSISDEAFINLLINDYFNTDKNFRPSLMKAAVNGKICDEILAIKKANRPILLIFGQKDKIVNVDYLDSLPFAVWQDHIYKLPDAGHWTQFDVTKKLNELLACFAGEVFTTCHALRQD